MLEASIPAFSDGLLAAYVLPQKMKCLLPKVWGPLGGTIVPCPRCESGERWDTRKWHWCHRSRRLQTYPRATLEKDRIVSGAGRVAECAHGLGALVRKAGHESGQTIVTELLLEPFAGGWLLSLRLHASPAQVWQNSERRFLHTYKVRVVHPKHRSTETYPPPGRGRSPDVKLYQLGGL